MEGVESILSESLKNHAPDQVLLVFDVNFSITLFDHPAVFQKSLRKHREIYKEIRDKLTKEQKDRFNSFLIHTTPQLLIEAGLPALLQSWQGKGIKTIACTAVLAGGVDEHPPMEEYCFSILKV